MHIQNLGEKYSGSNNITIKFGCLSPLLGIPIVVLSAYREKIVSLYENLCHVYGLVR
jgi:hypothetical protein